MLGLVRHPRATPQALGNLVLPSHPFRGRPRKLGLLPHSTAPATFSPFYRLSCVSPKIHILNEEAWSPSVTVLGMEPLGGSSGLGLGGPHDGISVLTRRDTRDTPAPVTPLCHVRTQVLQEGRCLQGGGGEGSPGTRPVRHPDLRLPASGPVRNAFLWGKPHERRLPEILCCRKLSRFCAQRFCNKAHEFKRFCEKSPLCHWPAEPSTSAYSVRAEDDTR